MSDNLISGETPPARPYPEEVEISISVAFHAEKRFEGRPL